ncbi:MAG: hypothetical protein CO186_04165 [Zetaproteobacteria bacterium CG_4_9_14_3_um_filter_49_83]|nr:MAG: hypothetical protein AUJ56_03365 [Zetaproteobacteria bacterium CG1_02_49_23]PIQ33062.1 MAG: hypothetical protein COW62_06305 [Zetaproteobacteria bacterium CG17_big_fil_post_rev_8_21_14_2_50_50_13]PIV31374.1 MAG: hypothetical protein COS35_01750 [Zetaproteobacteria bacterium CG02_land_8_20_14_3_00_50_9]PIY56337.1 MAG: hypothetical protein COZ00_04725 [Zetaproteobacteria bacterium CG_4_10_14_0_8_um_filter_49_80]PJA35762.1 MAG: hypothetical protein CO186_04165 [Zetaproteobacteria bacterium
MLLAFNENERGKWPISALPQQVLLFPDRLLVSRPLYEGGDLDSMSSTAEPPSMTVTKRFSPANMLTPGLKKGEVTNAILRGNQKYAQQIQAEKVTCSLIRVRSSIRDMKESCPHI